MLRVYVNNPDWLRREILASITSGDVTDWQLDQYDDLTCTEFMQGVTWMRLMPLVTYLIIDFRSPEVVPEKVSAHYQAQMVATLIESFRDDWTWIEVL
jgi:hypothetical protein